MSNLKICRICLMKDLKMYNIEQFCLRRYYEEIADNKMQTDNLPLWFCYECAALLHKYHKFKEKCAYGQNTLINLYSKGYMTYEVVEDIRKNRIDLLSKTNYIIPNKHTKTYYVKHKTEIKPSEIENVLINEFDDDNLKYEYIPETDDEDITLDKINSLDDEKKDLKEEPKSQEDLTNNYDDNDDFDMESTGNNDEIEISNKIEEKTTEDEVDLDISKETVNPSNGDTEIFTTKNENELSSLDDSPLLFSILKTKPKRSKNKLKEQTDADSKPRKFEKKSRVRLNKDNWEIKILSEEEALEQFRQRINNSKYIKFNFKCTKCLKGFSRNDILLRHNKQCHDGGKFECRFCHMQFKRKFELGRHMVGHYYVYQCLRCELKCNLLSTAVFHEDSHNGVIRTCKDCGEQFKHVSTYYTHLRMSHRNSHVCKLCGASFVSETGLDLHKKRQHCISEEITEQQNANIYCEKCDVSFVSRHAFDEHLVKSKLHEDEAAPPKKRTRKEIIENATTCRYCREKFTTRAECRKHVAAIHKGAKPSDGKEQDRVMCEICGGWLTAASLDVHMNRHTKKKIYPCQFCGKEFLCKSGYNTHQAKHTGIRPHACKICHKRFSQKFGMDIHYRRVHLKEPYPKRNRKKNTDEVPLFEKVKWT